jgi:hypothetical protein
MLTPTIPIQTLTLPKNMITVALHVRKGSWHDRPCHSLQFYNVQDYLQKPLRSINQQADNLSADELFPCKFPPDRFYIDQVIFLSELFEEDLLYVFLFTDAKNPKDLIEEYRKRVNKQNIIFDCHNTSSSSSIIDDYWNIAQFDCLVRSASNFSRASQLLGNHRIVISASHGSWHEDALLIDKINVFIQNGITYKHLFYKINEINKYTIKNLLL